MIKTLLTASLITGTIITAGCGFHLRGIPTNSSEQIPTLHYPQLQLDIPNHLTELHYQLKNNLISDGIQIDNQGMILKIVDYQFRRQQLNGKLTEVLLHLNVTFHITDASGKILTKDRTVRSYRNYQYDIETVNTENQQETYLKQMMIQDIAQQISTQIANNRLPLANY